MARCRRYPHEMKAALISSWFWFDGSGLRSVWGVCLFILSARTPVVLEAMSAICFSSNV